MHTRLVAPNCFNSHPPPQSPAVWYSHCCRSKRAWAHFPFIIKTAGTQTTMQLKHMPAPWWVSASWRCIRAPAQMQGKQSELTWTLCCWGWLSGGTTTSAIHHVHLGTLALLTVRSKKAKPTRHKSLILEVLRSLRWALFFIKNDEVFDRSDIQPASVQAAIIIPVTMEMVAQLHCLEKLDSDERERWRKRVSNEKKVKRRKTDEEAKSLI